MSSLTVTPSPSRQDPSAGEERDLGSTVAFVVCVLLVVSTVSWRHWTDYVFYEGGTDPIVVGKAMLSAVALVVAYIARQRRAPRSMGDRSVWLLIGYVVVSTLGAWSTADVLPSFVLGTRLLMHAATVVLLVRAFAPDVVLRAWLTATMAVGLFGAVTGVSTVLGGKRLEGGIPPLNPNEVALLCALPAIGLVWLALVGRAHARHAVLLGVLLGVIWLTGSRATLLAVGIAFGVMLLQARKLQPVVAFFLLCAMCALVYLTTATSVLASFFGRGGAENVATLGSRTIAWTAAFSFPETDYVRWLGAGLARKQVPVEGQYWDEQLLDSSWISALVQAGYIGATLLLVWVVATTVATCQRPRLLRMMLAGLLTFLLLRGFLESGLVDSTPAFVTFFLVSLLADKRTHLAEHPDRFRARSSGRSTTPSHEHRVPSSVFG